MALMTFILQQGLPKANISANKDNGPGYLIKLIGMDVVEAVMMKQTVISILILYQIIPAYLQEIIVYPTKLG